MYPLFKRFCDLVMALIAIVALFPLMVIVALEIKIDSPGSAIFKQKRLGKNAEEFEIYKFRSMYTGTEKTGSGVYSGATDSRVTKVGKFIRATSIDELPQLFNILRGDMSFIGPRPPLTYHPWHVGEYTSEQLQMFSVRPGITGWTQINGRKDIEWNTRIKMNIWYVQNASLWLDVKILFTTVIKVLKNENNVNIEQTLVKEPIAPTPVMSVLQSDNTLTSDPALIHTMGDVLAADAVAASNFSNYDELDINEESVAI